MSKTLSYANLTAYAEQAIRHYMAEVATHRAAGEVEREARAQAAAYAVHAMWESLVVQHLEPHGRKSFMADFARLDALVFPDRAASPPLILNGAC
ncbi:MULTISPECIES: hypothetical protein [unclassified Burkholderia]|uniref:hypothetical protein n=1 Tax=unclassified Burkholderia TaxID=2613784 RepID=UPI000755BFB9|nr:MULTISPECIES: hypothetical protein [unclassified Burkholderia]KVN19064.1 hypothetical protein WT08_00790 [Burkholderia sp. MSMB1552]KWZ47028.1 hypothetical protein WS92_30310 [Burkholderia sp. MSMB1588]